MDRTVSPTEAAAALKEHFAPRLEAGHDEGIHLMTDVLQERFGISRQDARAMVGSLERARTLQWIEHDTAAPPFSTGADHPITPTAGEIVTENFGGTTEAAIPFSSAYWRL